MKSKMAALQLTSSDSPQENLDKVKQSAEQAVSQGVQLLLLPEMWLGIGNRKSMLSARQNEKHSEALDSLRMLAQKLKLWVVAGAIGWQRESGDINPDTKAVSRCMVIDSDGGLVAHYDKMHMFDVNVGDNKKNYRESDHYDAGDSVVVVDSPFGKLGLSICYDLRFPELYRKMWQQGADIFLIPSAFTEKTGRLHWETLLRARAIENCSGQV